VPAGDFVIFGVKREHAQKRLTISFPFRYSWEESKVLQSNFVNAVEQRLYFYSNQWPEKLP
jgi:hypothetical protein